MTKSILTHQGIFSVLAIGIISLVFFPFATTSAMAQTAEPPTIQTAPINPEFLRFQEEYQRGEYFPWNDLGHYLGYIPAPMDLSHLKGQKIFSEDEYFSFPATYDLRTYGRITAVRNQGTCGSCWAFASYGALESTLLTKETWDFSEMNLKNTHGFDYTCCYGGNHFMSSAYFARWSGPWNETDDPYANSCTSTTGKVVQKHIQDAIFIPDRASYTSNDDIKQALMTYGAVYTCFYMDETNYYSPTYHSYYYNGSSGTDHCVTIAGWDDNFDKTHFKVAAPGNGAFLIKNSWGTSWGASGYFYISYYDTQLSQFVVFFGEPTVNYDAIYQYDPLGWVSGVGYGGNTGWFANIFTAGATQNLVAVSFHISMPSSPYEIYIYKDVTSGPRTGTLAGSKTGTITTPGYHTILLNAPISLTSSQKFSAVVKLTTPGDTYPIPYECAYSGYSSGATAAAGQSYFSPDGSSWQDITTWDSTANVCVKAFASTTVAMEVPRNSVKISKSGATQIKVAWGATCGTAAN